MGRFSSSSKRKYRPYLTLERLEDRTVPTTFTFQEGTGANAAAIQSTVDAFRSSLGTLNANVAGSFGSGRREINWDGVPNALAAPNALPGDFFNTNSPRGVILSTPGSGFEVSANAGIGPVRFDDINGQYSNIFATFSAQRLFTPIDSNVTDITFFVPGSTTPASVNGFGAVFTDVDNTFSTKIEFFSSNNVLLFSRTVLPTSGNSSLSFLGAKADTGTPIFKVRITAGAVPLGTNDITQGGTEKVVMDDFIYGEPLVAPDGGSVSGIVFNDVNGDGVKQGSEPVLPGITVYEDGNGDGIFDNAEKHTQTAANGTWSLTFVADGVRRIRQERPFGSTQTTPNTNVNIFGGSSDTLNFGDQLNTPVTNVTVNAPNAVNENGQVTISGTFDDADSQSHTVTIDFGDGSTPGVINLAAGVTSYSTTHIYLDDAPSGTSSDSKTISVTVSDGIDSDSASRNITVNNVAPSNASVTATPTTAGSTSTITVTFTDPGTLDPHLIDIDFGDGSPVQSFGVAPGQGIFNNSHVYSNVGSFTITATVHDDDLGTDPAAQTTLTVTNPDTTPPSVSSTIISKIRLSDADVGNDALTITVNFDEAMDTSIVPTLTFSPPVSSSLTLTSSQWVNSTRHVFTYSFADANVEVVTFVTIAGAKDVAGNQMVPDQIGIGLSIDTVAPLLTNIDDGDADNVVIVNTPLTYTITFSENISGGLSSSDLDNAGTAVIDIGTITNIGNGVFTAVITPTSPGTLRLRLPSGATVTDLGGNPLATPVFDDDTLTVILAIPVVTPPASQSGSEGTGKLFNLGSFTDPNNSGNYLVTVNWGDGTPNTVFNQAAAGTITAQNHTYAQDGNFNVRVTVSDVDGASVPAIFQANISNVLPIAVDAPDQSAVATIAKSFALGSFSDPGADAPWHITVSWGDGSPNGQFTVNTPGTLPPLTHTFANAGDFTVTVTVQDDDGSDSSVYQVHVVPPIVHLVGSIFRDFNGNGVHNSNDVGLTGVTVFADRNGNHLLDSNEPSTTTGAGGQYLLDVGFEGPVNVRQAVPAGFHQTTADAPAVNGVFGATLNVAELGNARTVTPTVAISSRPGKTPFVQVRNADGSLRFTKTPFGISPQFQGEVRVATGDINDDGVEDVIVGAGPGGKAFVQIWNGIDGSVLRNYYVVDARISTGLFVASGDVNGDGFSDVIVGFDAGTKPIVAVINPVTHKELYRFNAFSANFRGGVRVAAGDVNGDGLADIITATGAGTGPGQVKVFDGGTGQAIQSIQLSTKSAGYHVAAGDLDGDGKAEIILGANSGTPQVRVYSNGVLSQQFTAIPNVTAGGVRVAAKDLNGDGKADLLFATGVGVGPKVRLFDPLALLDLAGVPIGDAKYRNGLFIG